jgi:GNAT superfamily N-acetyltransferase
MASIEQPLNTAESGWKVRPAARKDSLAIWRLVEELAHFERLAENLEGSPELVEKWLFDSPVASALVAEWDGRVIGYAITFLTLATFKMRPGLWLEDLYVSEAFRGQGVGKALIQEVVALAKEKGYARVDWTVLEWNVNAIDFYESLGAKLLGDWRLCRFDL